MFQTIESSRSGGLRWRALAASLAAHAVVLFVGVVLPLVFLQVLPAGDLLTFLMTPAPHRAAPPPPPPGDRIHPAEPTQVIATRGFVPPETLPRGIPEPPVDPDPSVGLISGTSREAPGIGGGALGEQIVDGVGLSGFRPTLPPPPPPLVRREPVKVGGKVQDARLVHRVDPVYPELARRVRLSGTVVLEVLVSEEGTITELKVLTGHPLLNDAAVQAVSQWRYAPLLLNGEPVPVLATVTVVFSLR
jgi:periplasmic protein TonB